MNFLGGFVSVIGCIALIILFIYLIQQKKKGGVLLVGVVLVAVAVVMAVFLRNQNPKENTMAQKASTPTVPTIIINDVDWRKIPIPMWSWFSIYNEKTIKIKLLDGRVFTKRPGGADDLPIPDGDYSWPKTRIPGFEIYLRSVEGKARIVVIVNGKTEEERGLPDQEYSPSKEMPNSSI